MSMTKNGSARIMVAKFSGRCGRCGCAVIAGEQIAYRGQLQRAFRVAHPRCDRQVALAELRDRSFSLAMLGLRGRMGDEQYTAAADAISAIAEALEAEIAADDAEEAA